MGRIRQHVDELQAFDEMAAHKHERGFCVKFGHTPHPEHAVASGQIEPGYGERRLARLRWDWIRHHYLARKELYAEMSDV